MKSETIRFLKFIEEHCSSQGVKFELWKIFLRELPIIYNNDISFRLLFDWHIKTLNNAPTIGLINPSLDIEDLTFKRIMHLLTQVGAIYKNIYQIRELVICHAKVNLTGKHLLEIGGSTPNDVLFDQLEVYKYTNIESPDYIHEEGGTTYSEKNTKHPQKSTIFCNAEDIDSKIENNSIDNIFSVACFEHIYDLSTAIRSCYNCLKEQGKLYSYFAPIYSHISTGDHGVIPQHNLFKEKPIGLHLLSQIDQRKKLIEAGITNPMEIQEILGSINFNRIPNRLRYEDYERILTESPFWVVELIREDAVNLHKRYSKEIDEIRKSNPSINNLMTVGFRTLLLKR